MGKWITLIIKMIIKYIVFTIQMPMEMLDCVTGFFKLLISTYIGQFAILQSKALCRPGHQPTFGRETTNIF